MRIEWNESGLQEMANQVARDHAVRVQEVLDTILRTAPGKSLNEVKKLLSQEVHEKLGGNITDPELTAFAEALAAGQRIDVRP